MEGSHHISRREFITLATAAVGSLIGVVVGLPAIAYLISVWSLGFPRSHT